MISSATYLRIDCLYRSTLRYELDQTPTYKAVNAISQYILEHPESEHMKECRDMLVELNERLDKKAYEAAKLYYKMEDYLASRVAFKNVLKDDSDNIYREDILYYVAMSSYKYAHQSVPAKQKERYLAFVDDYYNFIGEMPESSYRKELDVIYSRAQKALGKQGVVTEDNEMTEKDFAKERRKVLREAKQKKGEEKNEEAYLFDLRTVKEIFDTFPEYIELLHSPAVSKEEKIELIDSAFSDRVNEHIVSFLKLMCENNRIEYLYSCFDVYEKLYNQVKRVIVANVTSAIELNENEKAKIKSKLEKKFGYKVELVCKIDEKIIGGIIIKTEDAILDGSLKRKMHDVKEVISDESKT